MLENMLEKTSTTAPFLVPLILREVKLRTWQPSCVPRVPFQSILRNIGVIQNKGPTPDDNRFGYPHIMKNCTFPTEEFHIGWLNQWFTTYFGFETISEL